MKRIVKTEREMMALGEELGGSLVPPATIELVGDVGAGKTTLAKGIAKALGVADPITSPSFTLEKTYEGTATRLAHYDFYRLQDPGIMAEDLAESIADPHTITVVEWAATVADVLPTTRVTVTIAYLDDGTRQVEIVK